MEGCRHVYIMEVLPGKAKPGKGLAFTVQLPTSGRGTKFLIVWSDYFEMRLGAMKDCSGLSMTEAQQSISSKESNKPSKTSYPCH